jgi:hypothetical protein
MNLLEATSDDARALIAIPFSHPRRIVSVVVVELGGSSGMVYGSGTHLRTHFFKPKKLLTAALYLPTLQ